MKLTKKPGDSGRRVHALESDQPDGWKFCGKDTGCFKNAEYAANDWKYISVAIFLGLGIYLIIKAARGKEIEERKAERLESRQFAMWMAITSLDVFIAGIGFGFLDTVFFKTFIVILLITPVSVIAGLYAGWWAGCQARKKIVAVGGCLLLIGGIELLIRLT